MSLYRKNYVAAGIVFMLHNYATRDRLDRDRRGEGTRWKTGMVVATARNDGERANRGMKKKKKKTAGKVFRAAGRRERVQASEQYHPANE